MPFGRIFRSIHAFRSHERLCLFLKYPKDAYQNLNAFRIDKWRINAEGRSILCTDARNNKNHGIIRRNKMHTAAPIISRNVSSLAPERSGSLKLTYSIFVRKTWIKISLKFIETGKGIFNSLKHMIYKIPHGLSR